MIVSITRKYKNNYPSEYALNLDILSHKIFESLDETIREYNPDFKLERKKYKKKWVSAKGKLIYRSFKENEPQSEVKINFSASYPFIKPKYETCYVQIEVESGANRGRNLDEKIFNILEEKFYSFRKESEEGQK